MRSLNLLDYLIIFIGLGNLIRMTALLIGSDLYGLFAHLKRKREIPKMLNFPTFSIVIPAHNERKTIIRTISSIFKNKYPLDKLQVIVVDDGSTDSTVCLVENYKKKHNLKNLKVVKQANSGKANALNNGIKQHASGELVMCLDADSYIDNKAIANAVNYFKDKSVSALSANVKIVDRKKFLNILQKYEYIICYQMKRAQTTFNIEYIIGGIGSTFRQSVLKKVNFYDADTVTEDIDLTMKIIREGNKKHRVIYGSNVIAYTESCLSIGALIRQRFRWKWGRCQTFLKNIDLFFNSDKKYSKQLTWLYLPYAILSDFTFFLEPFIVAYILFITLYYHDIFTVLMAFVVISTYISMNILAEDTIKNKDKARLLIIAPAMYLLFYILSFVEYIALIKAYTNIHKLKASIDENVCRWQHVERPHVAV